MAVEIYNQEVLNNTKAVVEIFSTKDEYIPSWEFHFPERDSLDITEIIALHSALFEAANDLDNMITMLTGEDNADGEI